MNEQNSSDFYKVPDISFDIKKSINGAALPTICENSGWWIETRSMQVTKPAF